MNLNIDDNIDNIAFAFFSSLVICSILNDSYSVLNNFYKSNYIKKKISYFKKISNVLINLTCNNYKNDKDGNIIIDITKNNKEIKVKTIVEEPVNVTVEEPVNVIVEEPVKVDVEEPINVIVEPPINVILKKSTNPFDEDLSIIANDNIRNEIILSDNELDSSIEIPENNILNKEIKNVYDKSINIIKIIKKSTKKTQNKNVIKLETEPINIDENIDIDKGKNSKTKKIKTIKK